MKELIKIARVDEGHTEVVFDLNGMEDAEALVEGLCTIFKSRPETVDVFKTVILFYEEIVKGNAGNQEDIKPNKLRSKLAS